MIYIISLSIAIFLSFVTAQIARRIALRKHIVDDPGSAPARKFHASPVPLLGGWPIFISISGTLLISLSYSRLLLDSFLSTRQLVGIIIGAFVLVIGGTLDDKYNLTPAKQILWPIVAVLVVIAFGIGIPYITHPFGGVLVLDSVQIPVFEMQGIVYSITFFSDLFTLLWLMVVMYAMKFLDGLDGLASGMGVLASLLLFMVSMGDLIAQPGTALVAIIVTGACFGFWLLNRVPAKMFLGEGGSLLIGFFLGLLSIISGAKIATALLILAFPILDIVWVIVARMRRGKKIWSADRSHLHFRLLDKGWSQQRVVHLFYGVSLLFGLSSLFASTVTKFIFLCLALTVSVLLVVYASKNKQHQQHA